MENIIISNQKVLDDFKKQITKQGIGSLLIVADFDRTITEGWIGDEQTGKRAPSLISILRDEPGYLTPDYSEKAKALGDKYHPIEIDLVIPRKQKIKAMNEWWEKAFELLFVSGFEKQDLKKAVMSPNLVLRKNVKEFFTFLKEKDIPLIFISASGLGIDSIKIFLEKRGLDSENIKIISNNFIWDKQGRAIAHQKPIVHTLNKGEVNPGEFGISEKTSKRKNILLLGDSIDDVEMALPFKPKHLLKIGFLDFDLKARLEKYKLAFDVVLLNNSPFDFINNLLKCS